MGTVAAFARAGERFAQQAGYQLEAGDEVRIVIPVEATIE